MAAKQDPRAPLPARYPIIPPLFRLDGWPSVLANSCILLFAALGGEWIVHQCQYMLLYGPRFGQVMAASPHRLYMQPLGLAFGVIAAGLLAVAALAIALFMAQRARLVDRLPSRLRRAVPRSWPALPARGLIPTALLLAWIQMVVYAGQENAESVLQGFNYPGLGAVISIHRPALIPLHLAVALGISILLWSIRTLLHRSREALRAVRGLLALLALRPSAARRITANPFRLPNRLLIAGARGLRSPPLTT